MTLDINRQLHTLVLTLTRPPRQMDMHDALPQRTLDIETHAHMLGPPLIRLLRATNVPVTGPAGPGIFAVGGDLRTRAQKLLAAWVVADLGDGAVEVGGFGGGGEDVGEEEGCDGASSYNSNQDYHQVYTLLCCAHHFFARGEIRPSYLARVAGQGD